MGNILDWLQKSVGNAQWTKELYNSDLSVQQQKLKDVFTVISDNNVDTIDKTNMEKMAKDLAVKVEKLEAKMAELAERISEKEEEIAKEANDNFKLRCFKLSKTEDKKFMVEEYITPEGVCNVAKLFSEDIGKENN